MVGNELPVEVIDLILHHFTHESKQASTTERENTVDKPFLDRSAIGELLQLRLINSAWSGAVLQRAYQDVTLSAPSMIECFKETWKHSTIVSTMSSVRRLCFDKSEYPNLEFHLDFDELRSSRNGIHDIRIVKERVDFLSVKMQDVEAIIKLCSDTLTDLKFDFYGSIGFAPTMIEAIKQAQYLDKLIIAGSRFAIDVNHSSSLKDLLNVTTQLRSLSLNFAYLNRLDLNPGSLPHLEHLFIRSDRSNLDAITHFCKGHAKGVKFLEYVPIDGHKRPDPVILALKDSLEYLFLKGIPISLPRDTCHKEFPRLKVIRSVEAKCKGRNIEWLKLKLFENMEVLITSYLRSKDYWRTVLSTHTISSFVKPARFNHVVFLASMMVEDQDLVENFRKHGIQCHFKYQWTYQDISEELSRGAQ